MFSDRTNWKLSHNRFTQAVNQVRAAGTTLLDLTLSNPTRVGLQYNEGAILASLSTKQALDYDPQPLGLRQAREAVARYYSEAHGIGNLNPDHLVLTSSTSEGYSYVFRLLCNAGDEVLVPKPSYPLFEFLADLQDVNLVSYPLIYDHGWQIDLHSLEKAVSAKTRAVVLVHPNNPTGSYVQATESASLNTFCRDNRLALIVDEVFLDYAHDSRPRPSFVANQDVLTFTLSGLSKIAGLPQMKLAWIASSGPEKSVTAVIALLEFIADTYLSVSAPLQWATPVLLDQRKSIQRQLLDRVKENLAELDQQLTCEQSCQRLRVEGGWYAVLRVPVTRSDEDLAIELVREKSVLVHPGDFYDFPTDGHLVLSLITPASEFAEGMSRIMRHFSP